MTVAKKDTIRRRILAVERMLLSGKPITTQAIIRKLDLEYDIQVERKTVYQDIAELNMFMNIVSVGGSSNHVWQYVDMGEILKDD